MSKKKGIKIHSWSDLSSYVFMIFMFFHWFFTSLQPLRGNIMGISMGSSEGAGYANAQGVETSLCL